MRFAKLECAATVFGRRNKMRRATATGRGAFRPAYRSGFGDGDFVAAVPSRLIAEPGVPIGQRSANDDRHAARLERGARIVDERIL